MSKKLNRIFALLMSILLIAAFLPTMAFAAGKINTDQPTGLSISYKDGSRAISDARFSLYKVADVDEYAQMTLTPEFEAYKTTVDGLSELDSLTQEKWLTLASSLNGYVLRDHPAPAAEGEVNSDGMLSFPDLKVGLYLVVGYRVTTDDYYTYSAVPSMLFLPGRDTENNAWSYDVSIAPKFTKEFNPPDDPGDKVITRKVLKVWDDAGYEEFRPSGVVVQLLRDGAVFDTQTLNKENNWRFTWDNLSSDFEWSVVEKTPTGYAVTITRTGVTFTVCNKYIPPVTNADLPVKKTIIGDKPAVKNRFTFVLTAKEASCPMPAGSSGTVKEFSISGAGVTAAGKISFTKPGTYVYTVSEKKGKADDGYTYDTRVYTVTCEVVRKNGALSVTRTITDDSGKVVPRVEFTNSYKALPHTGVLWWPVPLCLFVGFVLVMIGVVCRRRYS